MKVETIEIISNHLFANRMYFEGFDARSLPNFYLFLFTSRLMAWLYMGSSLGPLFANIFLSFHEKS